MTNYYSFPKMKGIHDWLPKDQFKKIKEEVEEVVCAGIYYGSCLIKTSFNSSELVKAREEYLMEILDVIHSAETLLRIEGVTEEEYGRTRELVINKNRERGYYDD